MDETRTTEPRIAVLGPVLVENAAGQLVGPSGALARSFIVALALSRGRQLSAEALIDELWADEPPRNARAALQTLVSRLRAATAADLIDSRASGYALGVDDGDIDLLVLERSAREVAEFVAVGDPLAALAVADRAVALVRGDADVELTADLAARLTIRADAARLALLAARAAAHSGTGDDAAAVSDLAAIASARPLDDPAHLALIEALASSGRAPEALDAFDRHRRLLRDQLGTDPSAELQAAHRRLLSGAEVGSTAARLKVGLRSEPNRLLGRDADATAVEAELGRHRVVTIIGPGGLGKTRLAQAVAASLSRSVPSVYFVELATVRNADDVGMILASTLGIREVPRPRRLGESLIRPDLRDRIVAQLNERPSLLVIDNCEHLVEAAALWVADIIASTAGVHVLTTSRSPLGITSEVLYSLGALSAGDDGDPGPAVELFIERATAARPGLALPLDTIARLCERLDGLPLAIELAAARVRSMSVEEIDRRLQNRFALLTSGDRTAPERHRTLLAVIDWSWNLLDDSERVTLRRLSRFPDGFSAEAAQIVAAYDASREVIDDLEALANQSLVTVSDAAGGLRYRMLETVREFGDMALVDAGEDAATRDAMFAWAATLRRDTAQAGQLDGYAMIRTEQENLVALLREAIAIPEPATVASIFSVIGLHWTMRSEHEEVIAFGKAVVQAMRGYRFEAEHAQDAAATYTIIAASSVFGDRRTAAIAISGLRRVTREHELHDQRLRDMADLVLSVRDLSVGEQLLADYRASPRDATSSLGFLISSQLAENSGESVISAEYAEEAWDRANRAGDVWIRGMAAMALAQLHSQNAEPRAALMWADRGDADLALLNADQDRKQIDWVTATSQLALGRLDDARLGFERISQWEEGGFQSDLRSVGLAGLAEILLVEGDVDGGLAQYMEAVGSFGRPAERASPWFIMLLAACIAAHVRFGVTEVGLLAPLARRLRSRILAVQRTAPSYTDKPVLGSAALGLSAWQFTLGREEDGLILLALAEGLHARQDSPSLRLADHLALAEQRFGSERLDAARASVAELADTNAMAERTLQVFQTLN